MSESAISPKSCPKCGAALPSAATAGLCPRCLMAEAMVPSDPGAEPAEAKKMFTPAELAPYFPQLEILECLGRGGMGLVYKARQKSLNRIVALKLLAPERVTDAKFAERFAHEARALATLNHPNIVTIHDFGQAGGFYYLLMEFVDGVNLRQAMKAGRFTPEQALAVVPPVCEALQYAHNHGIVHRDIKPENLLLDREGRVMIADFGIAKMLGAGASSVGLAESQPAGTPQYMAPEQQTAPQQVDNRADIYSLGVVLYEMLTGELPGKPLEPPSHKVQIDVRLDAVVLRALEKKPELRYQQVSDVKTMIETIATTPPPPVASTGNAPQSRLVIVGRRNGRAVIHWPGALFLFVIKLIVAESVTILGSLAIFHRIDPVPLVIVFLSMVASTTFFVVAKLRSTPLEKLKPLDQPPFVVSQVPSVGKTGAADFQALENRAGSSASQSLIQEIQARMTADEKRIDMLCGILAVAGILFATFGTIFFGPYAAFGMFVFLLAEGCHLRFLASTAYARQQGITIEQLRHPALTAKLRRLVWIAIPFAVLLGVFLCFRVMQPQYYIPRPEPPRVPQSMAAMPEIESVVVSMDQAVIKQRNYNSEGMIFTFGTMTNRWTPGSVYFDHIFDVTLEWPWFRRHGANWVVKSRHGIYASYRLDGPPGPMLGKVVFYPGTPVPEADGSYVIGEFKPETGKSLPIAVRLVRDSKTNALPAAAVHSRFSQSAHLGGADRNVFLHHDNVEVLYVFFYSGQFGSMCGDTHNTKTLEWNENGSITLNNGRTFLYLRQQTEPSRLRLSGDEFDLENGRVIVLHDDGAAEQLKLFPSLATAQVPAALARLILTSPPAAARLAPIESPRKP